MGFVHDTGSKIFSMETRRESAYLTDIGDDQQLWFSFRRGSEVREEICQKIMKQAGEYFAKGDLQEADRFKKLADIVRGIAISPDPKVYSVEARYEWIRDLVRFCTTNKTVIGHLEALSEPTEPNRFDA